MTIINKIRDKIRENQYIFKNHALDKLEEYSHTPIDAIAAIMNGFVYDKLTHDPRGTRYVILGEVNDGQELFIVCRFLDRKLLIITCYEECEN